MRTSFALLITFLLAAACGNSFQNNIIGDWQAVAVLEDEMPLEVNTEVIQFRFDKNHHYTYNGTLKYHEAGTYHIESKYLYTIDTVNRASTEKAVEIVKLTEDSLFLKMNEGGKERIMKLGKIK